MLALACAVALAHGQLYHWKVTLTASPFSLMGVTLAIFLGFRINASYDRYWEGASSGDGAGGGAQPGATGADPTVPGRRCASIRAGVIAFAASMRNHLRGRERDAGLDGLLPEAVIAQLREGRHAPCLILLWLGEWLAQLRRSGQLTPMLSQHMEATLDELGAALGGCERIASTPLPFTYSVILHRSSYVYCIMLPFGLVDSIGWMMPLVVGFVSYTFFALEALSDEIEEPFGMMPNDLALDAIVSGIEASLREMLGEVPAAARGPTPTSFSLDGARCSRSRWRFALEGSGA